VKTAIVVAASKLKHSPLAQAHLDELRASFICSCGGGCDAKSTAVKMLSDSRMEVLADVLTCCDDAACVLNTKGLHDQLAEIDSNGQKPNKEKRFQAYQAAARIIFGPSKSLCLCLPGSFVSRFFCLRARCIVFVIFILFSYL